MGEDLGSGVAPESANTVGICSFPTFLGELGSRGELASRGELGSRCVLTTSAFACSCSLAGVL